MIDKNDGNHIETSYKIGEELHPTLGYITKCAGMRPYKGFLFNEVDSAAINGVKSLVAYIVYLLTHTPLALFFVFPSFRLKAAKRLGMHFYKALKYTWEGTLLSKFSETGKELNRVIEKHLPTDWEVQMFFNYRSSLVYAVESDDVYKYMFQDLIGGEMNKQSLEKNARKELKRLLKLGEERSHLDGVKKKYRDGQRLVSILPPRIIKGIKNVLLDINQARIKLDENDLDWAQHKPYDFGGVKWKGREWSMKLGEEIRKASNMDIPKEELEKITQDLKKFCDERKINIQIHTPNSQLVITRRLEEKK